MEHDQAELLRRLYEAFNARKVDEVLAAMDPDVDWPNVMEGSRLHGRDEVREYWRRQFEVIDSRVEPLRFETLAGGDVAVEVHQVVRDRAGKELDNRTVRHVYRFRDGLVERMDVTDEHSG
jgi:ketosteroid isomerase-like protein